MQKDVNIYCDNLLIAWSDYAGKSRYCKEILRIYHLCAGFMHETSRRRKQLAMYYKYEPLIAEKIEASQFENFFLWYLDYSITLCSHFIAEGYFKKAYKEFKDLIQKFVGDFGLKIKRGQK